MRAHLNNIQTPVKFILQGCPNMQNAHSTSPSLILGRLYPQLDGISRTVPDTEENLADNTNFNLQILQWKRPLQSTKDKNGVGTVLQQDKSWKRIRRNNTNVSWSQTDFMGRHPWFKWVAKMRINWQITIQIQELANHREHLSCW